MPRRTTAPPPLHDPLMRAASPARDDASCTLFAEPTNPERERAGLIPAADVACAVISGPNRRTAAHHHALAAADRAASSVNRHRQAALDDLNDAIDEFIRCLGVRAKFQAADLDRWLHHEKRRPDPKVLDMRVLGGLLLRRIKAGTITLVDRRADAPVGHNSSVRPVYEIQRLCAVDFAEREIATQGRTA